MCGYMGCCKGSDLILSEKGTHWRVEQDSDMNGIAFQQDVCQPHQRQAVVGRDWESGYGGEAFHNNPGKREWQLVLECVVYQGDGEKWLNYGHILKVKQTGSFGLILVQRERKGIKDNF